ncbi:MAG: peptidylprolyl isomerase, partial [Rhodothermales bacterium]|nr:peptidylprolyl isomerase [Rhodothermales bacterium]
MIQRIHIALLALFLGTGCSGSDSSTEPLAVVNGRTIGMEQYQRGYREYLFRGGLPDEPTRRSAFLNRLIAIELIASEARDAGIEGTPEYGEARDRARQKLLIEAYLADNVYDLIEVTDQDLLDQFVRVNTQMTARHLRANSPEEAQRLAERLEAGETFEDLAPEVFADPVLASNGGLVGTFGFDEMDPAFEDAAFRLRVGDVSEPIQTAQGFSIIKLEDRFTKPVMTETEYAESKDKLEQFVRARKQVAARRAFLESLLDEANPQIDAEAALSLMAAGDEESPTPVVTFTLNGEPASWTLAEIQAAADFTSERQRRSVDNANDFKAFVEGLVARTLLLDRAEAQNLGRDSRVRQGLDSAMGDWIYEQAFDQLVANMELTEDELRAYFEANDSEFQQPRRVRLREIVVATKSEADALRSRVTASNFEAVARQSSLRPESAASGGDLGLFAQEELGPWGDDVFKASSGDILGPLPSAGKYILLKVERFEAPRPATFEESRSQVEAMLRRERQQSYLREHVQMLR